MNEEIKLKIQAMKSFCDGAALASASENKGVSSAFNIIGMQLIELMAELQDEPNE